MLFLMSVLGGARKVDWGERIFKLLKSGEVLPFLDILQRQNGYKMVDFGNEVLINLLDDCPHVKETGTSK